MSIRPSHSCRLVVEDVLRLSPKIQRVVLSNKVGRTKYTGERRKTCNRLPIAVKVFALVYRLMPCATAHAVRTGIIRTRALLRNLFAISQTSCDGAGPCGPIVWMLTSSSTGAPFAPISFRSFDRPNIIALLNNMRIAIRVARTISVQQQRSYAIPRTISPPTRTTGSRCRSCRRGNADPCRRARRPSRCRTSCRACA